MSLKKNDTLVLIANSKIVQWIPVYNLLQFWMSLVIFSKLLSILQKYQMTFGLLFCRALRIREFRTLINDSDEILTQ